MSVTSRDMACIAVFAYFHSREAVRCVSSIHFTIFHMWPFWFVAVMDVDHRMNYLCSCSFG